MKHNFRSGRRCPFPDCSSQRKGHARIVRHGRYRCRRGSRPRLLCRTCKRTFAPRRGTVYYRLRSSRGGFDLAMKLQVEGMPQASAARAASVCASTISRWRARAAAHAQAFENAHLVMDNPVELQLDELCARGKGSAQETWVYCGIEVSSRLWLAAQVGARTRRTTRLFLQAARAALGRVKVPVLVTTDPFIYYERELRRAFGPMCVYVQVENHYRRDRILRTESRLVLGSQAAYDTARSRSEDGTKPNTSYSERLNLFARRSCSYLQRRTPAPMRSPRCLTEAIDILRCYYNFVRPHSRLALGKEAWTPAMQANIFDRPLSFREIFNWVPPPTRKRRTMDFRTRPPTETWSSW